MYNEPMINYKDFIPQKNGFVFKFKKVDDDFIHTFIEGNLVKKLGLSPSMVVDHTLFNFLPEDVAKRKMHYYERAWNGEDVNYEGFSNGVYYLAFITPNVIDGRVVEVLGTAVDITNEKKMNPR